MRQSGSGGNDRGLRHRWLLLMWIGVIILLVFPWLSFRSHAHWERVQWVPFFNQRPQVQDIVANVLLYLPLGYWSRRRGSGSTAWPGVVLALVLSAGTEVTQVYSHGRFPSVADIVCNVFGGWLGTGLWRRDGRPAAAEPDPS